MNPHNHLRRTKPKPQDWWECQYCKENGTLTHLSEVECSYEYPPCDYCGQTPECARDCRGVIEALSDPNIYIAGQDV